MPQDLALYPTLSARVNLNFFGRIYGLRGKELKERVEDVLRIVALTDRADQTVDKYSGGYETPREHRCRAGSSTHSFYSSTNLPWESIPQSRNHIFESVLRLNRERGMSVVYTSHYMEEVELLVQPGCHHR